MTWGGALWVVRGGMETRAGKKKTPRCAARAVDGTRELRKCGRRTHWNVIPKGHKGSQGGVEKDYRDE